MQVVRRKGHTGDLHAVEVAPILEPELLNQPGQRAWGGVLGAEDRRDP
jgi:hypothetical protein